MKRIKRQLIEVEGELIEAKKLRNEKRREARSARSVVKKRNKQLALETAMKAVEGLKQHRSALEGVAVRKSTAPRNSQKKKRSKARRIRRGTGQR
jgi:hypothetical protein